MKKTFLFVLALMLAPFGSVLAGGVSAGTFNSEIYGQNVETNLSGIPSRIDLNEARINALESTDIELPPIPLAEGDFVNHLESGLTGAYSAGGLHFDSTSPGVHFAVSGAGFRGLDYRSYSVGFGLRPEAVPLFLTLSYTRNEDYHDAFVVGASYVLAPF